MSGEWAGCSGWGSEGWPGWVGWAGVSGVDGCCCITGSPWALNERQSLRVARRPILAIGPHLLGRARVAELVDALDLGSSIARCGGSSPSARTITPRSLSGGQSSSVIAAAVELGI